MPNRPRPFARGVTIVSSGDLVQRFEAAWTADQLTSHRAASEALYRIKDRAFAAAGHALRTRSRVTEYDLQQQMVKWFEEEGLVSDSAPVVAIGPNAGNPHYLPAPTSENRALAWLRRARELDATGSATLYNVACALAMLGERDEALDALEQAVSVGFGHRTWFEQDPDLAPIRDDPRFTALLERIPR